MSSSRVRSALLVFAGSTIVGLFFATQAYFNPAVMGLITWEKALAINLTYYYCFGLAVPLIVWLGGRFPLFGSPRWGVALVAHVFACLVVTGAIILGTESILKYVFGMRESPLLKVMKHAYAMNFNSLLPIYWVILLGAATLQYYVKFRDRELRASQLETRLSEARLAALKMQLRPHFLFNTLNSISSLMYSDRESADAMLARLADFLRMTIDSEAEQLVPLARELEFVRRYLAIEQIRLEDRLRVEYDIDREAHDAFVPNLVLQPLVENAIHHGVASRADGGVITIGAKCEGGWLRLSVADDGAGLGGGPERVGVGLANTQARLQDLYGDRYDLRLARRAEGGVIVEVTVPVERRGVA